MQGKKWVKELWGTHETMISLAPMHINHLFPFVSPDSGQALSYGKAAQAGAQETEEARLEREK